MSKFFVVFQSIGVLLVLSVAFEFLFKGSYEPRVTTILLAAFTTFILMFFACKSVSQKKNFLVAVFLFVLLFLNAGIRWLRMTFPLRDTEQVLLTIQMPVQGFVEPFVIDFLIKVLLLCVLFTVILYLPANKFYTNVKFSKIIFALVFLGVTTLSVCSFINDISVESFKEYASFFFGNKNKYQIEHSDFLEKYYVNPDSVKIVNKDSAKNLIFIFLESMENRFVPYMPQVQKLLDNATTFYKNGELSGGTDVLGTKMTISAMIAKTAGIPFLYSNDYIHKQASVKKEVLFPNQKTLYEILENFGYKNVFMQGSDAHFAGTGIFFKNHGISEFYDINNLNAKEDVTDSLKKKKFHPGFTDRTLFRLAKNVLDTLSKYQRFSLTIATIDTHFPYGFYDEACAFKPQDSSNDALFKAVLQCEEKELLDFIKWIQKLCL